MLNMFKEIKDFKEGMVGKPLHELREDRDKLIKGQEVTNN